MAWGLTYIGLHFVTRTLTCGQMSISKSLRRAAQLQEQIDRLRGQLAALLDQARAEVSAGAAEDAPATARRGQRKSSKKLRGTSPAVAPTGERKKTGRSVKPVRAARGKRRSPLAGRKRAESPSGPLAPAVVKVLQSKKQPMNVRDILEGLTAGGYQFSSPEPRKNLAARIYRLPGVKQVSSGLFGVA